ncbi:hypothetical protein P9227_00745 [Bacillus licheniformis]|uniref:hypothetical protein n=1 Tax=Bacillus licheniformis TaxID=1402 RepID=UPI002E1E0B4D|nr:hypothetical protein [Bacillus licheniformis]
MIENIVAGIIATLICSILSNLFGVFKNRKKDEPKNRETTLKEVEKVRKQFFVCLIYLFIVVIGFIFNLFVFELLLTFISVTIIFIFIILWGAFDAIYYPLKSTIQKTEDEYFDKDSNGN